MNAELRVSIPISKLIVILTLSKAEGVRTCFLLTLQESRSFPFGLAQGQDDRFVVVLAFQKNFLTAGNNNKTMGTTKPAARAISSPSRSFSPTTL